MRGVAILALAAISAVTMTWAQEPQRIRVTVERRDSAGWIAVNAAHVFETNDRLRFRVTSSFNGYLYVMDQGTSGGYELLFPRSDTGSDNRIAAGKDYAVPASQGIFKVTGPSGHDVIYWLVSPVDLGSHYQPLPPAPEFNSDQLKLRPRCDESILKARGDCIDTQAGVRPVKPGDKLPENMNGIVTATPREMLFIQDNRLGQESVVISSPAPLSGPVVYELRLAHR